MNKGNIMERSINMELFAKDLKSAREEVTLKDLTDHQWDRVCNRIANSLHKQGLIQDWDEFIKCCKGDVA